MLADRVMKQDLIALDRDTTNRYTDEDGRLHIRVTNISKANVCPYLGREIPDHEKLGLDPDKIYKLLRDPDELRKAAPTFNNIQLLSDHIPVASDASEPESHRPMETVGSTGTDCVFKDPYLQNSLVVWAAPSITGIETKQKRELSSSYRYDADMTPGTYKGVKYDGVMRNIRGNHVAIVETGRAGSDVYAADTMPLGLLAAALATDEIKRDADGKFTSAGAAANATEDTHHVGNTRHNPDTGNTTYTVGSKSSSETHDVTLNSAGEIQFHKQGTLGRRKAGAKHTSYGEAKHLTPAQSFKKSGVHRAIQTHIGQNKSTAQDSALNSKENADMAKKLTRAALYATGATSVYLSNKLAADAAMPSLVPVFEGVTHLNWKSKKPTIAAKLKKLAEDKKLVLAADADLDDVSNFLDKLDGATSEVKEEMPASKTAKAVAAIDPDAPAPKEEGGDVPALKPDIDSDPKDTNEPETADADPNEALIEFLGNKLPPEDMEHVMGLLNPSGQGGDPDPNEPPAEDDDDMFGSMTAEDRAAFDEADEEAQKSMRVAWKEGKQAWDTAIGANATTNTKGPAMKPVTKAAMDAALKSVREESAAAILRARTETITQMRAANDAAIKVMPIVGKVVAMDSAEAVFKFALDTAKVPTKGVHPSAYGALVDMLLTTRSAKPAAPVRAMDSKAAEGFDKRWPTASFVKQA